jgi:hypothetical protein
MKKPIKVIRIDATVSVSEIDVSLLSAFPTLTAS